MVTTAWALPMDGAFVSLQGRTISCDHILNESILSDAEALRPTFVNAYPFPHIVLDGLFSPDLLQMIWDDFGDIDVRDLKVRRTEHEVTFRSQVDTPLPASAQIYFDAVNSGRFVKFLTGLSGISGLITDCFLQRGGLHESRDGGKFDVHIDFNKHPDNDLDNRLVLLTYLNRNWREDYGGALELWAPGREGCVTKVIPEFGRSIIMQHTNASWHGHPKPVHTPDNRTRRSLATYYYSNGVADPLVKERYATEFLEPPRRAAWKRTVKVVKSLTPPVLFDAARRVKRTVLAPKPAPAQTS